MSSKFNASPVTGRSVTTHTEPRIGLSALRGNEPLLMSGYSRSATGMIEWPWLQLVAMLPFVILVVAHWNALPPLVAGDYAQYLLHAKAIAEHRPYASTGYIFTPLRPVIGPQLQPPGLPLTLAPIVAIAGTHTPLLKLPLVLSVLVFLHFVWRYLAQRYSVWTAAAAVAITGVALEGRYATVAVISDLGFCALIWALIYVADREEPWSAWRVVAIALLGMAAMSYRVAGIALVPAVVLWTLVNRKSGGWRPLAAPLAWVVVGLLAIWERLGSLLPKGVLTRGAGRTLQQASNQLGLYRSAASEALLYPFPQAVLNDVYHGIAFAIVVVGGVLWLKNYRRSFLVVFAALYAVQLLFAPVAAGRYAWPLFPIIVACFMQGGAWCLARVRPGAPAATRERAIALAVLLPVIVAVIVQDLRQAPPPSLLGR